MRYIGSFRICNTTEAALDTLLSMRVFAKVVEAGSFTEAARRLNLSPPMVTRHVQSLEQRIGALLINRTTHRFSLTEAGAMYHERCVRLLSEMEDAEEEVAALGRLPRGRLRLTAPPDFGRVELWPIVRDFMLRYPDIKVDLVLTNRVVDLVEEEIDLAVRMSDGALDGSLIARKLAVSRRLLCAAPGYLGRAGELRTPDDLLQHECLLFSGAGGRHEGWILDRAGESRRLRVTGGLQASQLSLLAQAAVEGRGIAMQPTFAIWRHLADGRLRAVLEEWSGGSLGVFVVFPSRRFLPAKTRVFIDVLTGVFRNDPDRDVWLDRAQRRRTTANDAPAPGRTGRSVRSGRRG